MVGSNTKIVSPGPKTDISQTWTAISFTSTPATNAIPALEHAGLLKAIVSNIVSKHLHQLTGQPGYDNITIYLNAPDDNFEKTLNLYSGTSSAGLTTSDNGKTWSTKAINIAIDEFTNAQ